MEAYTAFAQVYDSFMDNIPYEEWSEYLVELLQEYGVQNGVVADLGCGTGNITELLAKAGYDMIGIDNSEEMLLLAREKSAKDILYLLQDMREMELYGTVAAMVSICDSMNYIVEKQDLLAVFQLVNYYLEENGVFIFDLNTEYKYETIGDSVIAENREDKSFIWENFYYSEEKINEYNLTIYTQEENGLYRRWEEIHYQRAYGLEEIRKLLEQAGMQFIAAYDAFTKEAPKADSERIYIVAGKGN